MSDAALQRWMTQFRQGAQADQYARLRTHLRAVGLPDKPELLVGGTTLVVVACAASAKLDGRPFADFLRMQSYDPGRSQGAEYAFTFDLGHHATARILVPREWSFIDLADLYGHPWEEYRSVGYGSIYISRVDGGPLTAEEAARLEGQVTDDLRYDYTEEELDLWFDPDTIEGVLIVAVQDHEDFE